eukprot:5681722-Pyramimonas_sp.AAC.1
MRKSSAKQLLDVPRHAKCVPPNQPMHSTNKPKMHAMGDSALQVFEHSSLRLIYTPRVHSP